MGVWGDWGRVGEWGWEKEEVYLEFMLASFSLRRWIEEIDCERLLISPKLHQ